MLNPDGSTRFLLVRHGRTVANARGLLSGRHDVELDAEGERQAAAVAEAVNRDLDGADARIVSSPLLRATRTAAAIAEAWATDPAAPASVDVDDRFVEMDYGEWDGRPLGEVPAAAWRSWRVDPGFCPPGGETLAAVTERVSAALRELTLANPGRSVVVTSHVSPIKAAITWALGVDDAATWRMRLTNASISEVLVSPDRSGALHATMVRFNDTAHLR
ncbi:MAG: histidine phosphatase family protein [Microthrixaceae bacterium]